ncbi:FAD/NAD(P)-binding domain-containing protein [Dissoconium aciculare CBS 342.82]|uniref:FAD/NAD(P)-binding domain-containing protein n=1 Tax=Dissoconium aciculare CBS 342.82 TaxID=1314786 RepID=A0A6J3LZ68_9PEZI|nr:FAD/NAD(P)-binding domain-containing protein [Dissoconium aciculare CBS 342.82]KAF1821070.1 FAD/NAD(P)-binding domain-containing protein [Dissoconium aciculare CBS 342.82]
MMKTVCIVGAGPAGLVAAKTLLGTKQFQVVVLEKAKRVGGIWALDHNTQDGFLSAETPTNISKFAVGFSDFRWDNPDLVRSFIDEGPERSSKPAEVSMFPKAWQVNRYLEAYRAKNIPDDVISLGMEVIGAERLCKGSEGYAWKVTTRDHDSREESRIFDRLIIAAGFFSKPRPLSHSVKVAADLNIKAVHSSAFKSLKDLALDTVTPKQRTILMLGGGNSSGEAAAAVAQQISDLWYSPESGRDQKFKDLKIVHVIPRPFYAVPPYVPADGDACSVIPIDFRLYDLSRRPAGTIVGGGGRVAEKVKGSIHDSLQSIIGGNQADLGSTALSISPHEPRATAHVALSESYPEFVRSGLIQTLPGRVVALEIDAQCEALARIVGPTGDASVDNIAAVVYSTGYSPASALEFLSYDVKAILKYDPDNFRLPVILEGWQTMSHELPDLAFLGFYEGPYWGVIEMQAKLIAHRWTSGEVAGARPLEDENKMLDLREAMKQRELDVPQYWFGDYLGYLDEIAMHLKLERNDRPFKAREGCTSPARYLSPETDKTEADYIVQDLHKAWHAFLEHGRGVPRAAFRALQGDWVMSRTIDSALPSFPSGTLEGVASFHPRSPSKDKSSLDFDFEYLYIESGTLKLSNGASMPAKRRYVYRYSEARDELSVWFVKADNDLEVDYLFHNLTFAPPAEARHEGACVARADHLCVKDMYWTEYRMPLTGISLHSFSNKHTVKGPSKDYVAMTRYSRHPKDV